MINYRPQAIGQNQTNKDHKSYFFEAQDWDDDFPGQNVDENNKRLSSGGPFGILHQKRWKIKVSGIPDPRDPKNTQAIFKPSCTQATNKNLESEAPWKPAWGETHGTTKINQCDCCHVRNLIATVGVVQ